MNTDVPKAPVATASDESTAKILAGAPPAPLLSQPTATPAPSTSAPSAPSAVKTKPLFTGTVTAKLIYGGAIYQPAAPIGPAPLRDLKKFGKLITGITRVAPAPASPSAPTTAVKP